MSSVRKPIWRRIALSSFVSFGLLHLLTGVVVLLAVIRHHTHQYRDMLARLTQDLVAEYASCGGDTETMRGHFKMDIDEHGRENVFLLISSSDGRQILDESACRNITRQMLEKAASGQTGDFRVSFLRGKSGSDDRRIALRARTTRLSDGAVLSVGYNVTTDEQHVFHVAMSLAASLVFTLVVGAWLGAYLARRFTAPLGKISETAGRIAKGEYSARGPETDEGSEITELEIAFNSMAKNNEKTLSDLKRLTDDIAHDLRTPLTRLRAACELHAMNGKLQRPLDETVSEEAGSMLELINTMLDISQTDNRIDRTPKDEIDLVHFVGTVADLYSAVVEESGITMSLSLPGSPVFFRAHKGKLQQMLGNLLDNAVKFTPRGGRIEIVLSDSPITLAVSNTGAGISPADIPHVFKRFWRADAGRSLPGNGLGLALVKAIVTSYGGTINCESSPNGKTCFTVVFG